MSALHKQSGRRDSELNVKAQSRKGSILNIFGFSSNEKLNETIEMNIQLFNGRQMSAVIDVIFNYTFATQNIIMLNIILVLDQS